MNRDEAKALKNEILVGIDKDECDNTHGWWETSAGVQFGSKKLKELDDFVDKIFDEINEQRCSSCKEWNSWVEGEAKPCDIVYGWYLPTFGCRYWEKKQ